MFLNTIYLLIGLVVIVMSAGYFISGSSLLAKRFGIPKLIIGLTIIAVGTSAPEFGVNIISSMNGHNELALGNILGSNIANILLIFGFSTLFVKKITISKNSLTQVSLGLLVAILILAVSMFSFESQSIVQLTQLEGIFLVIFGLFYWFYLYKITRADSQRLEGDDLEQNQLKNIQSTPVLIVIIVTSLIVLLYGSNLVTERAVAVAHLFGISELVIAGTIVAIGTSLPELVTSISAIRQKQYDLLIGNIIGSNIVNTLFILGTSAMIHSIPIHTDGVSYIMMNVLTSVLILIGFTLFQPRVFKRWQGCILVLIYIFFLIANVNNII